MRLQESEPQQMKKSRILVLLTSVLVVLVGAVTLTFPYIPYKKERLVLAAAFVVGLKYNTGKTGGWCDDAAKDLQSVLNYFGIESEQINMTLQYGGAHSALAVKLDGKSVFVDPYFGYAAVGSDGHLVEIGDLWANLTDGKGVSAAMRQIGLIASDAYYQRWYANRLYYAVTGSDISLAFEIPKLGGRSNLTIGIADGSPEDVRRDGAVLGYTPYWTYLGVRYDSSWTRSATATEDVIFEATAVEDIRPANIKSEPPPSYIIGKRIGWHLAAGDTLILYSNQEIAGDSQDVDYWTIMPHAQKITNAYQ